MATPPVSIVIPTRGRAAYLAVALDSIAPQVQAAGAEVVVVEDGPDPPTQAVCAHANVGHIAFDHRTGANAARNAAIAASHAPLVILLDDDVQARPGWLQAYVDAAAHHPDIDAFAGRILARLEGPTPRSCGHGHGPPISFLDLGNTDVDTRYGWSANMMVRRSALDRLGPLDPTLKGAGEEEEWLDRLHAEGGRVRYIAAAAVDHRRSGPDAGLRRLARAAYARGRAVRRYDLAKPEATTVPTATQEATVLARCLAHAALRRCATMLVLAAHSAGRLHEAISPTPHTPAEAFLSGTSGHVAGRRAVLRRAADRALDTIDQASGRRRSLDRAARQAPPARRVLALIVARPDTPNTAEATRRELQRSRHQTTTHIQPAGDRGKFQNINLALAEHLTPDVDWLLLVDDDVELPAGFLNRFLLLAERHQLRLAQPAQTLASHAAWPITRRRPASAIRETSYVEIGPVTAFHRDTFDALLPFPPLKAGWGLDHHWAAVARERGWPIGIVDATAVRHELRPVAVHYGREEAIAEASQFLADRPHVTREEIRTLVTHRDWR